MHTRHTLFLSLSLLLLACSAQADPQATGTAPILKWLWTQGEHFAEHPELVGESGTGWKQYARTQHFYEGRRKPDGTLPTVDELRRLRTDHDMRSQAARRIGNPYFELGPTNIGGRVLDIEFDPNVPGRLYAATAGGGLARSTDDGNSWTMITDQLPSLSTSAISVNPNDSNKLILATGGQPTVGLGLGIFYSLDGGASWQPSNIIDNTPWIGFNRLLVTPTGAVHLAFSDQGIYRSTDDGATWSQVVVSGNWWDAMIVDTTIFAVAGDDSLGNGGIYRSFDGGQTWFKSGTGQPTAANVGKSRLAESQGTIFALIGDLVNDSSLGLWTSVDNGDNWVQNLTGPETGTNYRGSLGIGNQIRSGFNLALAVDPSNANNIMTGGQYGLLSTDGGLTWTAQEQTTNDIDTPHVDYHAAVWRNGTLWVGTDGGIYTTDDLGVTWTPRNSGMGSYLFNSVAVAQTDLSVMFGGAQDNRGSGSVGATQWQYGSGLRGDGSLGAIDPTNALNVYIDMQNGNHYRSTDGGVSFVQSNSGFGGDNTSGAFVNPLAMDPNTPLTLYAATNSNNCACGDGLWRTTDGMPSGPSAMGVATCASAPTGSPPSTTPHFPLLRRASLPTWKRYRETTAPA